uniref:Uncharacterized protein n=1 Tax=Anguilla anguilla TaxID=7936 RepID=A0A0E9X8A9_ANGAN
MPSKSPGRAFSSPPASSSPSHHNHSKNIPAGVSPHQTELWSATDRHALGIWSHIFLTCVSECEHFFFKMVFKMDAAAGCVHASLSVDDVLLAVTVESDLRVIRSNSAWTSVKTGFCLLFWMSLVPLLLQN